MATKHNPERYGVTVTPVLAGRLVLHARTEADARPWVKLLTGAGVDLTRTPNGGYMFTFDDRPDLTGADDAQDPGGALPGYITAIPARSDARRAAELAFRLGEAAGDG